MALKKQTVWLLTMLSLVIVLSVYYVTAPTQDPSGGFVFEDMEQEPANDEQAADKTELSLDGVELTIEEFTQQDGVVSGISSDEFFTAMRMDIEEQRSREIAHHQEVVASANVSADKKSEALDKIQDLQQISAKEDIIEQLIRADKNFEDALVRADGNTVKVIVKAETLTKTQANQIMRLVNDELGANKLVSVEHQLPN